MQPFRHMRRLLAVLPLLALTAACSSITYYEQDRLYLQPDTGIPAGTPPVESGSDTSLRIMTLNLAHGRGTGFHQFFAGRSDIRENLDRVAEIIRRERVQAVAVQEADAASGWSGGFNHVEYLLEAGELAASFQGLHVKALGLQYGAALLADRPLTERLSFAFRESSILLPRGFVVASLAWPGKPELRVDVVSVHLDFLSGDNRMQQARTLVEKLQSRGRPLILMGDFNTRWQSSDDVLAYLAETLGLSAYRPEDKDIETFPRSGKRVDWILISDEFEFLDWAILPDKVSDHRAVVAEIGLRRE